MNKIPFNETNVEYPGGAKRGSDQGKSRPDLVPGLCMLRVGLRYGAGAAHYGEHNFCNGIPSSRALSSLQRHLEQWKSGDTSEDHLSAIVFNANLLIYNEEAVQRGLLESAILDLPVYNSIASNPTVTEEPTLWSDHEDQVH